MLKEAPVFNRRDRIHQVRRQFVKGDQAALGAILPLRKASNELRFQLIRFQRLAAVAGDLADHTVVESYRGALLGVVRLRAGMNGDGRIVEGVGAHPRIVSRSPSPL